MCVYIVILITDMIVAFYDQSVEHYKRISWVYKLRCSPPTHIEILIYDSIFFCFMTLIYKTLTEILIFRFPPTNGLDYRKLSELGQQICS